MSEETATNPVEDDALSSETGVDEAEPDQAVTLDDDGNPVQAEDDTDEIEHDGQKYRIPKALKPAMMMHADYTRKTQEVAESRKALEARETEIAQRAEQQQALLQDHANVVSLKSQVGAYKALDWEQLEQQDVANGTNTAAQLWRQYERLKDSLAEAEGGLNEKVQRRAVDEQRETARRIQEGYAKLPSVIPGWNPDLEQKVAKFGREQGLSQQELAGAVADPRSIKILHLAMIGAQSQQQQAATKKAEGVEKVRPTPRIGGGSPPAGLHDSLTPDEWARRRNEQLRKRG